MSANVIEIRRRNPLPCRAVGERLVLKNVHGTKMYCDDFVLIVYVGTYKLNEERRLIFK